MTEPGLAGLAFHHVGLACHDIEAEAARLAPLGYRVEGPAFADPRQGVRGLFVGGQAPRLELLEPLPGHENGVLSPWLAASIKLYHLAYETPALAESIAQLRKSRAKVVVEPVPAVAFDGRHIAFLLLPNRLLVELIEGKSP
ncbi:MAG: VOC family protein [Burkholderiales bacterium]